MISVRVILKDDVVKDEIFQIRICACIVSSLLLKANFHVKMVILLIPIVSSSNKMENHQIWMST